MPSSSVCYHHSCWPTDRQANDNNGNCATPYDENCVDADPADNTDLCAVDMDRSNSGSTKVPGGFATFDSDTEGPIHCHGFVWGIDDIEADACYKGNNLFYVSMYDHMYQVRCFYSLCFFQTCVMV